jgi:hypothetical protein
MLDKTFVPWLNVSLNWIEFCLVYQQIDTWLFNYTTLMINRTTFNLLVFSLQVLQSSKSSLIVGGNLSKPSSEVSELEITSESTPDLVSLCLRPRASLTGHILEHESGTAYLPTEINYREVPNVFAVGLKLMNELPESSKIMNEPWKPDLSAVDQDAGIFDSEMAREPPMEVLSEDELTRQQLQQMVGVHMVLASVFNKASNFHFSQSTVWKKLKH